MAMVVAAIVVAAATVALWEPSPGVVTTTSGTTTTSTGSAFPNGTAATSVSFSPDLPIRIDNVTAVMYQATYGTRVTFQVQWTNLGGDAVYVAGGCGSGLSTSAPSKGVLQQVVNPVRCMCVQYLAPVEPGQSHTSLGPGCWSSYAYQLVGHGSVDISMTLTWMVGNQPSNSTAITAQFRL